MWRWFLISTLFFYACIIISAKRIFEDGPRDRNARHNSDHAGTQTNALQKFTSHISWIEWRQLVRNIAVARCTLLKRTVASSRSGVSDSSEVDEEEEMRLLAGARSESFNELCHRPIMLLFYRDDCSACHALLQGLGNSAEFELLSEYMTMVVADSMVEITENYPYPQPHFRNDSLFFHGGRRKNILQMKETEAVQEGFAGQGEYFPRVLFIFPQNGSVMPIFNQGEDSNPSFLHFYHETSSLLHSMMVALWTMNEGVNFSEL
ncbi:hypothetical protein TraAM80_09234 [Trypanosoma rangeli]|uniref:Thioredoxin domain-containing protein n=1 Tax=Trypanosoma rangeli TaxID=5698 RepID=A0A3R7JVR9_TRYRA|nr:uncharacterized protein TraAM80_09234 [Trypanosoma rangeli]RNE97610.1 hypothetical protein TraAM80_09234 [Trypanosoma rangeli]|eukprot:RNE97610.1 hypothetical protein TraAM80_09234 [Trypanosoma rangeli]